MAKNLNANDAFNWTDLEKAKTSDFVEVKNDAQYLKFNEGEPGDVYNMRITGMKEFIKDGEDVEVVCFETKYGSFVNGSYLFVKAVKDQKREFPFFARVIFNGTTKTDNGKMDDLKIYVL